MTSNPQRVRIKFCGVTRSVDVHSALELGVDAIGFNLARGPRRISPQAARELAALVPPLTTSVAVFADAAEDTILEHMRISRCQVAQLHGAESWEMIARLRERFPVIKAEHVRTVEDLQRLHAHPADLLLLDAPTGGSGQPWDHGVLDGRVLKRPFILAGGLTAANVAAAIKRTQPMAVDVSSGIESVVAHKDPALMAAFVAAVRSTSI